MNAATHAVFGVAALAGTALLAGTEPPVYAYPVAVVASWLPDVDGSCRAGRPALTDKEYRKSFGG